MTVSEKYIASVASPHGVRALPASKSLSNRALVINRLAGGDVHGLHRLAQCDDTDAVVAALPALDRRGCQTVDVGAAGTAMRFLTACFALDNKADRVLLTGSERMKHRPIGVLVEALRSLGADIAYEGEEGFPPLGIRPGGLAGGGITIDGSISSQYISALLMVGPRMQKGLRLRFEGKVASRPYIEMTIALMRRFGAQLQWVGDTIAVEPGNYRPVEYTVESDWSAASYWYEILALSPDAGAWVELPDLELESLQGDSCVARWFEPLGVRTEVTAGGVKLSKTARTASRVQLDFALAPDLAQTLVVTCCCLGIPFEFTGLESLKIKETDRIAALRSECAKLGYTIDEPCHGSLSFDGRRGAVQAGCRIETYSDHRMAMAFAPATLAGTPLTIVHPEVVSKSYPRFWEEFDRVD